MRLFRRAARDELGCEPLSVLFMVGAPAFTHQPAAEPKELFLLFGFATMQEAPREPAVNNQVGYAVRVAHRVRDGNRGSLREPEQRKALEAELVDDAFEVLDPALEGDVLDIALRHALSARVESDQRVSLRKCENEVTKYWALDVVLEMGQPVRRSHDRRPLSRDGIGEPNAVTSRTVLNVLIQCDSHGAPGGSRTPIVPLRRRTPYPLDHGRRRYRDDRI